MAEKDVEKIYHNAAFDIAEIFEVSFLPLWQEQKVTEILKTLVFNIKNKEIDNG